MTEEMLALKNKKVKRKIEREKREEKSNLILYFLCLVRFFLR